MAWNYITSSINILRVVCPKIGGLGLLPVSGGNSVGLGLGGCVKVFHCGEIPAGGFGFVPSVADVGQEQAEKEECPKH